MKNKQFVHVVVLIVLITSMVAAVTSARETLTVYVPGNAIGLYGAYGDMAKEVADSLGYDVTIVTAGTWADYFEKIIVHEASGMSVDLILCDDTTAAMHMPSGLFYDLANFVNADKIDLGQFFPMSVDIKRYKNHLYAMPVNVGVSVLYYNTDLLANYGIASVPHDWLATNWNWPDFISVLQKATADTNGDGLMDRVGLARWQHIMDAWLWGSSYVKDNASRSNLDDPRLATALEETIKLYSQYSVVQGALASVDKSIAHSTGSFYKAQALFLPGMDADASGFAKQVIAVGNGSKINAAVFPKGLERHTTFNSWGWAIGSTSKNVAAAWKVIKGLTLDRQFIGKNALLANRLPAYRAAIPQAVSHLMDAAPIDWKVVVDALSIPDVAIPYPWYFNKNGRQATSVITQMLNSVTSGQKGPRQALDENHAALDAIVREGAW